MTHQPDVDDANASLGRLLAESVMATNRATHATRVIASGLYYTMLAYLIALIPGLVGLLLLSSNVGAAVFFFVVAALVFVIVGIRSIIVMFDEYRASTVPEKDTHERRLMNLASEAGLSRHELAERRKAEAADREARDRDQAQKLAAIREQAERYQAAQNERASALLEARKARSDRRRTLIRQSRAKYWLPPALIALGVAAALPVIAALQDASVVTREEYLEDFLSNPPDAYNAILKECAGTADRGDVRFAFKGRYGIEFRVPGASGDLADSGYVNCFAEKLTGETLRDLPFPSDRTQGEFIIEQELETAGDRDYQLVSFFPASIERRG